MADSRYARLPCHHVGAAGAAQFLQVLVVLVEPVVDVLTAVLGGVYLMVLLQRRADS